MPKIHSSIKNPIAETLLVPLYMRAIHSQKPNPIITDPDAVALLGKLPYQFDDMDNKPKSEIGIALRVRYFDDKARQFLTNHPQGVIINVGCGLDTRLQRLGELANRAYFYNLDIDEVITIRHQWLTPLDNEYSISSSMFEADWLDELIKKHPDTPFLFLIEGVMMYFDEDSNRAFMTMLADKCTHAYVYFDVPSKLASRQTKHHDTIKDTRAVFKFGLDEPKSLQSWHKKLHYQEHTYFGDLPEIVRMGKIMGLLMRFTPVFKKSFVMVGYHISMIH